jgi:hypothetical protein
MANALAKAPSKEEVKKVIVEGEEVVDGSNEHKALSQEFDPNKKYMFQLAEHNIQRELPVYEVRDNRATPMPHKKFKPYQNVVMTSQIVWQNRRRMIRYYDGCDSIFVDKQPKEKEMIDQLIKQSRPRSFNDGKFGCHGDERMLLLYLFMCSWNGESPFKTRTSNTIFFPVDSTKVIASETERLDMIEEALKLAKEAPESKMLMHADYLGIPFKDYDSDHDRTVDEIRIDYRSRAVADPKGFKDSYGNKKIEIKYYINKAMGSGVISNKFNPNKATWGTHNSVICDISGLRSPEAIAQALFEFSQTQEGEEFAIQLKALYEN